MSHQESNTIYLHSDKHLGDNVFNMILFYNIKDYIENNNITIYYYLKEEYLNQILEFVCSKNIVISSLKLKPKNINSINVWIDNNKLIHETFTLVKKPENYNKYYKYFFNVVLKRLGIDHKIQKLYYHDKSLINIYNEINYKYNNKYKDIDIIILNSQPLSGQYNYSKKEWDNYITELNKHFKIVSTTKVNDISCTMDDNLTVKSIAAISTKVKVIIAINSGVLPGLLNYNTLTAARHFYIFDDRCYYSYPNFENRKKITDITIDELKKYIN